MGAGFKLETYLWYFFHKPPALQIVPWPTNVIYDLGLMARAQYVSDDFFNMAMSDEGGGAL